MVEIWEEEPVQSDGRDESETHSKPNSGKRPVEEKQAQSEGTKKKKKKKKSSKADYYSKNLLGSEDDEIIILRGMISYAPNKKFNRVEDLKAFHSFIKKDLHVEVSRSELKEKIRRLKKKYKKMRKKEGKDDWKSSEQKIYHLAEKIWGPAPAPESNENERLDSVDSGGNENERLDSVEPVGNENERLDSVDPVVSEDERLDSVDPGSNEKERPDSMDKEWKKLMLEEIELYSRQMELKNMQMKLVMDAYKSSYLI